MAKFSPGIFCNNPVTVNRNNVFWMCDFDLPEPIKESKSLAQISEVHGVFCMGFYCDPQVGDLVTYRGYQWRVIGRHFYTYRHSERSQRRIPKLLLEFLGETNEE
ncbi:MAG TPA: hypothetical protein IGS53_04825 [Leptolyngbyaceae cyanobacterium M33_DOE_097]|uniref:Uncharacterized protein n=1 Tax=Oscillatoriales cyanobacterium SpSt-418 TaxID=2282169 RepID=A0A7C3PQ51_9CYAN|nr:hypothetical protein [Leptolyngbyaceae cyanobacterium M33_DOE_097]